jgi:hypothetical protein
MAKIGKIFLFVLPFLAVTALADTPKITAVVQPNPVPVDDSLQFRIEVSSTNTERVTPPQFEAPGFTIVGQNSSRSVNMDFGSDGAHLNQSTVFTYVLFPKNAGAQKISNIIVAVGDKQYPVQDIMVKVVGPSGAGGNAGNYAQDDEPNPAAPNTFSSGATQHPEHLNSDFTVHLALEKKTAYVGEPIVATYWIYASAPLREINIKRWPNFNGFWKEDLLIPSRYDWEQIMMGGRLVARSLVGRFALFGLKPGKIELEQLLVTARYVDTSQPSDDPFLFPSFSTRLRSGSHGSAPEKIEILPLPEAGRPADFGGAVGQFKISFTNDKNEVTANSPINFDFTVEGTGNFHAIEKIKIPFPEDFEVYDTKTNFDANAQIGSTRTLSNKKVFNYLVLPRKEGKFTIPEIRFSYFDPDKKVYRTFTTEPKTITVLPDPTGGQGVNNTYAAQQSNAAPTAQKLELRPLKEDSRPIVQWIFYFAIAVNSVLGAIVLGKKISFAGIRNRLEKSPRRKIALTVARLERSADSRSEHYRSLESAVLTLEEILVGRNMSGMTQEEREVAWREANLPAKFYMDLEQLLADAEQARYTGASNERLAKQEISKNLERLRMLANQALKISGKTS